MSVDCPVCGEPLENHGAESRGDGDMYDRWHCRTCRQTMFQHHASYCKCGDCAAGVDKWHRVDDPDDMDDFGEDYRRTVLDQPEEPERHEDTKF